MAASLGALFMVNLYQFKEISLFRHLHINSVKNFLNKARSGRQDQRSAAQSNSNPILLAILQEILQAPMPVASPTEAKPQGVGVVAASSTPCRTEKSPFLPRNRDTLANVYRHILFGWHPRRTELTTRSTKKHNFNENIFCEVVK